MKQFKIVSLLTILTLFLGSQSFFAQEDSSNPNASDKTKSGLVYQCSVNLEVISYVPGNCSKCGRKFDELTLEEAMIKMKGHGQKKPELISKNVIAGDEKNNSGKNLLVNEEGNPDENGDETLEKESTHEHVDKNMVMVNEVDRNGNGIIYQCKFCPDQLSDESAECEICSVELIKLTVEDAYKNLPKSGR